jgi:hypothetical protein
MNLAGGSDKMIIRSGDYATGVIVVNALKGIQEVFFSDGRPGGGSLTVTAILNGSIGVQFGTSQPTPSFSSDFPHAIDLTPNGIAVE